MAVMRRLGVDIVPVTNDNDRVTGVILGEALARVLRRRGAAVPRLRDVMRRFGFLVCRAGEELEQIFARLEHASAECAVVVDSTGRCVGVVYGPSHSPWGA